MAIKAQQLTPFITALTAALGSDNVLTDPSECLTYGYDNSRYVGQPDAVAFATTHEQVVTIVKLCNEHLIPLTVRGRGTGTPGGAVPTSGGLVLSLERMDQIIRIDPANRLLVAEPGAINQQIQDYAKQHGFFWAPDPSSANYCTLGGNLGYNSAGPRAVKYGSCRENTLGLLAVTGIGETVHTGVYTTKGVVGYDLTRLLIGSEGTLAIITEAILKLTPLQPKKRTMRAIYCDVDSATNAVANIMAQPFTPCALEFIDQKSLELVRQYNDLPIPAKAKALLIIEIDGSEEELQSADQTISNAVASDQLIEFAIAKTEQEVQQLWQARKALSPTLRHIAPKKINEDVVVPVAQIPEFIAGTYQLSQHYQIPIVNFGHAGNGNIHVNLLIDPSNSLHNQNAEQCLSDIFTLVLKLNGTLSGEHGVGIDKRTFIAREIPPSTLQLMQAIKRVFDPNGILNPGKIFPDAQN